MSIKAVIAAGIVAIASVGTAHANDDARFVLENTSGQPIDVIQVSPVASNSWGEDLLGDRVLRSGGAVVVTPGAAGCMFDVRVIYHSQARESFRNVNLCRTARISFANTRNYTMN
jgi:hypothetical protein